jgi:Zn-finger nucleic acid-binding protein
MSQLQCPKCKAMMRSGRDVSGPVSACNSCWGLWIDTVALGRAEAQHPVGNKLHEALQELDISEMEATDLHCATECGGELLEVLCRGVAVEFCSKCAGVFLDRGEREKLMGQNRPVVLVNPPESPLSRGDGSLLLGTGAEAVGDLLFGLIDLLGD